jgi:hypothetical protein
MPHMPVAQYTPRAMPRLPQEKYLQQQQQQQQQQQPEKKTLT